LRTHLTSLFGAPRNGDRPLPQVTGTGRASNVLPMTEMDPEGVGNRAGAAPPGPPGPFRGVRPANQVRAVPVTVPVGLSPPTSPEFGRGDGPFLDRPGAPPVDKSAAGRWFFYALVGYVVGQLAAAIFGAVAGAVAGKNAAQMAKITAASVPPSGMSSRPWSGCGSASSGRRGWPAAPGEPGICGRTSGCASAGSTSGASPSGSVRRSSSPCSTHPSSATSRTSTGRRRS